MAGEHNPYKLTPAAVGQRPSSSGPTSQPSASAEYQALDSSEWKTLTKGTKIAYEKKSDSKTSSGYVDSIDQQSQTLRMYNKNYLTNKYVNWSVPFANIKRISIVAQPYMKQASSGPASVVSPYQQFQSDMASLPLPQQPQQPMQQQFMQPQQQQFMPSQSFTASVDQSIMDRKISEIESKYAAKISGLEQELKNVKANLNEIVVFLTGLQVVLKSKGITK